MNATSSANPPVAERASPLWEIARIAAPSVATMTSYTLMQFVDGFMVSHIQPPDPVYLAASGNGGMAAWLPMSFMAGLVGVINTYVAQHLGAGKPERGPAYAWNGLWLCLAVAALMIPYSAALPALMASFGHSPRLQELECAYASILIWGSFFSMATRALAQFFYGLHRPLIVLIAAVIANLTNFALNYCLIFGKFGLPQLGVQGAAVGTVIASAVEFSIPLCIFLGPAFNRLYATRSAWRLSPVHLKEILRIGWPGALMITNEMVCWGYFMVALNGRFGEEHIMAGWIALRYMHLSFMPAFGISFAMTAVVGRYLGMGRPDLARVRARLGLLIAMGYMSTCAIAFFVFRKTMIGVFSDDPHIQAIGASIMLIAGVFQLFDAMGITIAGILRGAGDTIWPGVATVALAWSCLMGGGYLFVNFAPQLESTGPWIAAGVYIILLGLALGYRYLQGKWLTMRVVEEPAPAAALSAISEEF